jgi:hypothetical protein
MKIMEEVSKILGVYITDKTLDKDIEVLEISGRFTQRKEHELLVAIIKYLYERENTVI